MIKDISASIRARLKNIAESEGSDLNAVLTRYGLERLLYRIGQSEYAQQFLLKGALLFYLWYDMPHRPTRDIDLLGYGDNDLEYLTKVFIDISSIAAEDGIVFNAQGISADKIKKEGGYTGARIQLLAELSKARIKIQVDIGYGDAVTPGPIDSSYPVLISELPAPQIRTYPTYTVIAEKLHAIASLGMTNSRLKDYLDLYVLLKNEALDKNILAEAIASTFIRRATHIAHNLPVGLTSEYSQNASRQAMWNAFLVKNGVELIALPTVVSMIRDYIWPVMLSAAQVQMQVEPEKNGANV